jgi:hypothetical protein
LEIKSQKIDLIINNKKGYVLVFFFTLLVVVKQLFSIYKNASENIGLIIFNNVTFLYYISLILLIIGLRNKLKILFALLLIFFSDFFIDLKYAIQPYTFPLASSLIYKQVYTITCLLITGVFVFIFINKYFKYTLLFFIIKYFTGIIFLLFSKNQEYKQVKSDTNFESKKNCYILLFDEYPSQYVINTYLHHKDLFLDNFSVKEKFRQLKKVRSNYTNTEMSIPSILYGKKSNHFKVRDAINSLIINQFSSKNKFVGYSFFDESNSRDAINNSNFIHSINSFVTRYFFPLLIRLVDGKGHGVFYNIEEYHKNAFEFLDKSSHYRGLKKQVVFIHFFTPHDQVFSKRKNMLDRIQEANEYMVKSINIINKNDPNASVVIMSDHGYRGIEVPQYYTYNSLLMYKNIIIDTNVVNKQGIYRIFNN